MQDNILQLHSNNKHINIKCFKNMYKRITHKAITKCLFGDSTKPNIADRSKQMCLVWQYLDTLLATGLTF